MSSKLAGGEGAGVEVDEAVPVEENEIMVMTSSILEIINELAWRIDIPPDHIEEGRTGSTFETHLRNSADRAEPHRVR